MWQIVLLLRLVPLLPFNMLNYLLAVTPVPFWEYVLASWLGMMVSISIRKFSNYRCWFTVSMTHICKFPAGIGSAIAACFTGTWLSKLTCDMPANNSTKYVSLKFFSIHVIPLFLTWLLFPIAAHYSCTGIRWNDIEGSFWCNSWMAWIFKDPLGMSYASCLLPGLR